MTRLIIVLAALFFGTGCSIIQRVDLALERLGTTNSQLAVANQQLSSMQGKLG